MPIDQECGMEIALVAAREAASTGEVPVGAALFDVDGQLLAVAGNEIIKRRDPTAHAEMLVIRAASEKIGNERLVGTQMFVTLEPCTMCAGAISLARIERLFFGAVDFKGGAVISGAQFFALPTCHHSPDVVGPAGPLETGEILKVFFAARRRGRSDR